MRRSPLVAGRLASRALGTLAALLALVTSLGVSSARAQDVGARAGARAGAGARGAGRDSAGGAVPRLRLPPPTLAGLPRPAPLEEFGRLAPVRLSADFVASRLADTLAARLRRDRAALWGARVAASFSPGLAAASDARRVASAGAPAPPPPPSAAAGGAAPDSSRVDLLGPYADLALQLHTRIETKMERDRNERCFASQYYLSFSGCRGGFQPDFDFQFTTKSNGVVGDRVHVDVDYDSQREFDASNAISVYYEGKPDEMVQRLEVGNVSFAPPPSRFITSGIPSGNYGLQAIGQLGPMRFRTIVAQQKGNVVKDHVYTVGDRTLQTVADTLEDYQIEPRRFFFTVDPAQFAGYPNVDILNREQMRALYLALADSVRPVRVSIYRARLGGQPANPNGPQFRLIGDPTSSRGVVYEYLQPGVDYYIDPSLLWVALVQPLNPAAGDRLVVAYTVRGPGGAEERNPRTGGTPDLSYTTAEQFANLVWDPFVKPGDVAFRREIRSVYRIGGEDVRRESVELRVVTGSGGDQEKPVSGAADTYLQMFGLAQPTNAATFDFDNRLWPRPSDPNYNVSAGGTSARIIRDNFVVFPSLAPFARAGLVAPGDPANDTIYATPGEYLYSPQHPTSVYRLRARYQSEGGVDAGSLALGSVQVRRNSERITIDGVPLVRDVDYRVDYELGRVTFTRPDTLFPAPRQVVVRYEENPLFTEAPTSIFGLATQFPTDAGELNFTLISQAQRTTFNRPPLGFEPASSLIAGVSGRLTFDAAPLTRLLSRLPFVETSAASSITVEGEFATSRPQPNSAGQAYVESFEGEGGITVPLNDELWYYSSRPASTPSAVGLGLEDFRRERAATLAWQTNGLGADGKRLDFTIADIDSLATFTQSNFAVREPLLWLTLYPLHIGGLYNQGAKRYEWRLRDTDPTRVPGRRWRSIRTLLSASGVDLSRVETLEFWALVDTAQANLKRNATLVFDFGDVSENSLVFAPDTLVVGPAAGDSLYVGRRLAHYDTLDTERDPFSRTFDAAVNDRGLPNDRVDSLPVRDASGAARGVVRDFPLCTRGAQLFWPIGDARADCTVGNSRLDEEDLDGDNALNLTDASRGAESFRRFVVDLGDRARYDRYGRAAIVVDTVDGRPVERALRWVHFRIPFNVPSDSLNAPLIRRVRTLRLTVVSGAELPDSQFVTLSLARLRLAGAPWVKRAPQPLAGIAGERAGSAGFVIASLIGTNDRNPATGLVYQSPPDVVDEPENKSVNYSPTQVEINERSLRLLSSVLQPYERAEAYYRFPEGEKSFMGYKELRLWARGRGAGWGPAGELQFFVKIGRDANDFYLYRAPVNSGNDVGAWRPEVHVQLQEFYRLRGQIQNAYLQGSKDTVSGCSPADLALVAASGVPGDASGGRRYVACRDGYMVYTLDPGVTAPNLAAVQELAVGVVRVPNPSAPAGGGLPLVAGRDTVELWVDDIRLARVVDTPGYAGQFGLTLAAGDIADVRVNVSRRDPSFRQLAEQPTFVTDDALDVASSVRLDKFLPRALGLALPLTVNYTSQGSDPFFLSRSDIQGSAIRGLRTPRRSVAQYGLALRRVAPLDTRLLGALVNNLTLTANYRASGDRSEYADGRGAGVTLGAEYAVAPEARARRLPDWLARAAFFLPDWLARGDTAARRREPLVLRWNPTQIRFSSGYAKNDDRQLAFLKPADAPDDVPRLTARLDRLWKNAAAVELRPFGPLVARWDVSSLRDFRHYDRSTPAGAVAGFERERLGGIDMGLERERVLSTSFSFAPAGGAWLRPRADFGTTYSMLRDPNARTLLRDADSTLRLPRRLANSQTLTAAATVDVGRALRERFALFAPLAGLSRRLQPVDVSWTRNLLSAFDGTPFTPSLRYQFGLGGPASFRETGGRPATSAGVTTTLALSHGLDLPLGLVLLSRFNQTDTRNWTRRLDDTQGVVDGTQRTFPDLSLRVSLRPTLLAPLVAGIGGQAGARRTSATTDAPDATASETAAQSASRVWSYPVNASITWLAQLSTSAGYNHSAREDLRPGGSRSHGTSDEMTLDVGKPFTPPKRWGLKGDVRTRLGYQQTRATSFVVDNQGGGTSRLSDNGRRSVSLNADTDLSATAVFSLQGSRVVNFDNNFNRRFTQTVLSVVLQLNFFGGDLH